MDILDPNSLIERRKALDLTRPEFADRAGVAASTLWRIETGDTLGNIETWRALLRTLDALEEEQSQ